VVLRRIELNFNLLDPLVQVVHQILLLSVFRLPLCLLLQLEVILLDFIL